MVLAMRLRLPGTVVPALGADPGVLGSRARDPKRSSSGSGDIKVEDREVRQSYGLERSTTAPKIQTGEERQGLDPVTLSLKERG